MANKINLQILITKELETKSKLVANKLGFNNLQEMVRAMLISTVNPKSDLLPFTSISPATEELYKNEINKAKKDYSNRIAKTYSNADSIVIDIESE